MKDLTQLSKILNHHNYYLGADYTNVGLMIEEGHRGPIERRDVGQQIGPVLD